ncbi:MAG: hypothetical protein ABFS16_09695 [Bacteroidota bacterium]
MKRVIFFITLTIFLTTQITTFAQRPGHKELWEKYKSEKVAFLTTNLDLTPEEAQKFWPIYNQMDKEKSEAQMKRRELENKVRDAGETLTDDEIVKLTREFAKTMEKEGTMRTQYNEEFLKILPPKKVLKLYQAENEFRMHMFKKFRDQRKNGNKHP